MEYLNDELTEMQQVKRVVQQATDQYLSTTGKK